MPEESQSKEKEKILKNLITAAVQEICPPDWYETKFPSPSQHIPSSTSIEGRRYVHRPWEGITPYNQQNYTREVTPLVRESQEGIEINDFILGANEFDLKVEALRIAKLTVEKIEWYDAKEVEQFNINKSELKIKKGVEKKMAECLKLIAETLLPRYYMVTADFKDSLDENTIKEYRKQLPQDINNLITSSNYTLPTDKIVEDFWAETPDNIKRIASEQIYLQAPLVEKAKLRIKQLTSNIKGHRRGMPKRV